METVAFCEIEPFCQKVLNKHWPNVPIFNDIRKLNKEVFNEQVDVICGGFPCQPFSVAGRKKGTEDDRDLWPEMFRVIQEYRPTWVIGENVANFANMAFKRTKINLESEGYQVQPFIIPACGIEARHQRDRVWIIAHLNENGSQQGLSLSTKNKKEGAEPNRSCEGKPFADSVCEGSQGQYERKEGKRAIQQKRQSEHRAPCSEWESVREWRSFKPGVCGVAHGVSKRVDRIKALGNAIQPQIAEIFGRVIMEISDN